MSVIAGQKPRLFPMTWLRSALAVPCLAVSCGVTPAVAAEPSPWPTRAWAESSPEAQGLNAAALEALHREFAEGKHGYIDGMLVVRNGAVVFERSWGEELRQNGFPHGPTFGGHLLGCAAARETIRILTVERLVERARTVGAYMKKRLSELGQQHPAVARDVRGMGLLLAIELRPARSTTQSTSAEKIGQRAQTVRAHMARRLKELRREPRGLVREVLGAGRLLARQLRAGGEGRTYGGHPASQRTWAISEGLLNDRIRVWVSGDASSIMFCPPFIVTESQVDRLVDRLDFHLRQISREDAGPTATRAPSAV